MAGKFKYADPEDLINPWPGEVREKAYSTPLQKAAELGPGHPNALPPVHTLDDAYNNLSQVQNLTNFVTKTLPQEAIVARQTPEELMAEMSRGDEPGLATRAFETISKPFRYETSVFTAPIVAALESARIGGMDNFLSTFSYLYPLLQKEALSGDRELSIYDELRRMGMSNWGAIPIGILGDVLLSPSTYLGIGGPTKLGKLAKAATLSSKAGETIAPASKVGAAIAQLTERLGADEASRLLELAPTLSEQAGLGQRALLKWAGIPLVRGERVFKGGELLSDAARANPLMYDLMKAFKSNVRPPGVSREAWTSLRNAERVRKSNIAMGTKGLLEDIRKAAAEHGLSNEELETITDVIRPSAETEMPWDKIMFNEAQDPTALSALKGQYPGLSPTATVLDDAAFAQKARELGVRRPGDVLKTGGLEEPAEMFMKADPELSAAGNKTLAESLRGVEEGKNLFNVMPKHYHARIAKAYGAPEFVPELAEQFGKDWEKYISGNDWALSKGFKNFTKSFTREGSHMRVPGVIELTDPAGIPRRIVGDIKFVDEGMEAVRQMATTAFKDMLEKETALGILNTSVERYVPGIYKYTRGGKSFGARLYNALPGFTKEKTFESAAQAAEAGYEPVKNILELLGIRGHQSLQATETAKMFDEITHLFGIPVKEPLKMANHDWARLGAAGIDPQNYTQLTNYLRKEGIYKPVIIRTGEASKMGKEVWFQKEVADVLNKIVEPATSNETMKQFLEGFDRVQNLWKGYVTSVNPKFHIRNFVSNLYLLYLKDGMKAFNPFTHLEAQKILSGKHGYFTTDTGKILTYDQIREGMDRVGLKGSGFMSGELNSEFRYELADILGQKGIGQKMNPLSSKNAALQFGRKFGTGVENEAKVVGFLNDLRLHGNFDEAAKKTYQYLYDYMDLSSFEKTAMKRLIPFWTWMSKNIPNMMHSLVTQPGKIGQALGKVPMVYEHRTADAMRERGIHYPELTAPPYLREQGAFKYDVDEKGRIKYYVPGMPYQDLARLSMKDLLSSLTPAAKLLTEHVPEGGYSIFMDRPFEQYKGQLVDAPLGSTLLPQALKDRLGIVEVNDHAYMPGERAALINTLIPMLRTPQKLLHALQTPGEGEYVYPSELGGQKFLPIDPAEQKRGTLYDWISAIENRRKVSKGVERKEGRKLVESGKKTTLEEVLQLRDLRNKRY